MIPLDAAGPDRRVLETNAVQKAELPRSDRRDPAGRSGAWSWLAPLVLLAVAFGIYATSLDNPFLLDDRLVLETQPDVIEAGGWRSLWGHDYWHGVSRADPGLYRPLSILSFHVNARLTGGSPGAMRAANVAMLAVLAWLLAAWLRAWDTPPLVAWSAALLFLAHPLQAAVINYVVGRSDLQVLVGVLGFLLCQRYSQRAGAWSWRRIVAGAGCAALAIGSKESGAMLLPLALLQAWCAGASRTPENAPARRGVLVTSLALVAVPFAAYAIARFAVVGWGHSYGPGFASDPLGNPLVGVSFLERLPSAFWIVRFYVMQVIVADPSFWHVPDTIYTWAHLRPWLGVGFSLSLGAGMAVAFLRRSPALVALGFAGCQLLIVGQFLKPLAFFTANRVAGPFLIAAAALLALAVSEWTAAGRQRIVIGVTLFFTAAMGLYVQSTNSRWQTREGMVSIDFERHFGELDTLTAHASAMLQAKRYDEAIDSAQRATELRPEYPGNWFVLGTARIATGDKPGAELAFQRVIDLTRGARVGKSYLARALINLAGLQLEMRNLAAGKRLLLEAETIWPDDLRVLTNLAALAEMERDRSEAIRRWRQILERHPDRADEARSRLAALEGGQ